MKSNNSTNNRVAVVMKPIISVLSSIAKGKWGTIKTKTESLKAKLVIFSLLKPRHLPALGAISHKIHALVGGSATSSEQQQPHQDDQLSDEVQQQQMVEYYYNNYYNDDEDDGDNKYPDLRHCLFDEEEDDDPNASVIDQVRNSKQEEGHDFSLEDEIDHVADLFINKFHKRMRIQKLASFKRYQEMLSRST